MTEDEAKMQEYLRRHKPVAEDKPVVNAPANRTTVVITPAAWYKMRTPLYLFTAIILSIGIPGFFALLYFQSFPKDREEYQIYFIILAFAIFAAFLIVKIIRSTTYHNWVNGKLYPCTGWEEFLAKRSDLFWEGHYYTPIKITFKLKPEATSLHQEVVTVFLKDWEEKWARYYHGLDFDSGHPTDFSVKNLTLTGDVSLRGVRDVVSKMCFSVPSITRMLGAHLEAVVITSVPKETLYTSKRDSDRPDAYEMQQRDI